MIEFNGEISGNSRQFLFRLQSKYMVMSTSITAVIFLIPTILAAIYWETFTLFRQMYYCFFLSINKNSVRYEVVIMYKRKAHHHSKRDYKK